MQPRLVLERVRGGGSLSAGKYKYAAKLSGGYYLRAEIDVQAGDSVRVHVEGAASAYPRQVPLLRSLANGDELHVLGILDLTHAGAN